MASRRHNIQRPVFFPYGPSLSVCIKVISVSGQVELHGGGIIPGHGPFGTTGESQCMSITEQAAERKLCTMPLLVFDQGIIEEDHNHVLVKYDDGVQFSI